jgi:hypothetical protein
MTRYLSFLLLLAIPVIAACSDRLPDLEDQVKALDARNKDLVYELSGTPGEEITLDITGVEGDESGAVLFRLFWHTAAALEQNDQGNTNMVLASFGEPRYRVPGDVVNDIGSEYPDQNPVYLMRTFPARVKTLDGASAFPERRGGLLYVTGKQMEDFGDLFKAWLVTPWLASQEPEEEVEYQDDQAF